MLSKLKEIKKIICWISIFIFSATIIFATHKKIEDVNTIKVMETQCRTPNAEKKKSADEISYFTENLSVGEEECHYTEDEELLPDMEEEVKDADFFIEEIILPHELQEHSYQICQEYDIQYELFLAVMWKESRFELNQTHLNTNGTTDSGLMQINDVNRTFLQRELNITNLNDPKENIRGGAYILAKLLHKYDETNALIAYQYGEGGMVYRTANGLPTPDVIQNTLNKRDEFILIRN